MMLNNKQWKMKQGTQRWLTLGAGRQGFSAFTPSPPGPSDTQNCRPAPQQDKNI